MLFRQQRNELLTLQDLGQAKVDYNNYEIAEVLLRDRSVVYHYLQNHDNYIQHWDGYKELYDIAKIAVTDVLADYDINQKISLLESQITKLVLARDEIKKKFEEATS